MTQTLAAVEQQQSWTPDQMKLITDVVAKNATPDELKLFLYRCRSLGLDPLKQGQIYFVKYNMNSPGTIVVGIDGFRSKAAASGKLSGIKRGVVRDANSRCVGAWAEVFRTDWQHPAREEVSLAEYNTGKAMWAKMPETMIKKVAEAAALRMAFPEDLGGIYTNEEMDQAEVKDKGNWTSMSSHQPEPGDGAPNQIDTGYKIPFGKFAKRSLEEVDVNLLRNYTAWLETNAESTGKPLSASAIDFVSRSSAYLAALENSPLEAPVEEESKYKWAPPADESV